jgi:bacillithiol biosynthesis cysteine-adding enzyme BshC
MQNHSFALSGLPHTTPLLADYLENFERVRKFYRHEPALAGLREAAPVREWDTGRRREIVDVLQAQNRTLGADASTESSLARLGAGAVAVVTGQQAGLFSGPAYSFYKALGAVAWAAELKRSGVDAVPIFWLATEDHDLAEVDHCFWDGRESVLRLAVSPEGYGERRVGEIPLGGQIAEVVAQSAAELEGPGAQHVSAALAEAYSPSATFGQAFGKLMARLLAGRGVIFLDPLDERVHRLGLPVLRGAIEGSEELTKSLLDRGKELQAAGFHTQVKVTAQSTLVFLQVDGRREAVRLRGEKFIAGSRTLSVGELLSLLEAAPLDVSPNALLRPVMQDYLLPTAGYVGGLAEVAYFAQAERIYERLLGRMPAILPRASFTLIEPRVARRMKKYKLSFENILAGRQNLRSKMEFGNVGKGLNRRFQIGEKALGRLLRGLRRPVRAVDSTLLGAVEMAERKMLYQFQKLRQKTGRAAGFREGVIESDERFLLERLYPQRSLQERSLCFLPFLAGYGTELMGKLAVRALEGRQHQVLDL